jgi:lysophospholipase L1-like esterase
MLRLFPVGWLLLLALLNGTADEVVWPIPQPPAGTPWAQFPAPQGDTNFLEHIRQARSQQTDLILDGDSITDYWQSTGRPVFDKVFAPRHAIDFGMSGNHTESVLWRLDHGQLDTLHPKLAMILIGVNNSGSPVPDVVAGITKVVEGYRAKCPDTHILLLGIFPHGQLPTDPMRAMVRQTNALISKLDDGEHVTFLDIGDKFLQPDGTISPDVMPDALHPALKGYQIWADAVQPVLDKYCPVEAATAATPAPPQLTTQQVAATVPPQRWPYPLAAPAGTPSTIFPEYYIGWFGQFQRSLDRLAQGPYDLVFDGDAITMNWDGLGRAAMQTHYGAIKTLNLGIYADRVQNVLWRVQHGAFAGQNPKLIVLLIGTAQIGDNVTEVAGGVRLLLDEYKKRCPGAHILLLGVLPRDAGGDPWIRQLNVAYATLADDRVTFLDIGDKFRDANGAPTPDVFPDHLTEKGYGIWADAIQPVVDKYIPAAAAKP